jgi:hypothetical protein
VCVGAVWSLLLRCCQAAKEAFGWVCLCVNPTQKYHCFTPQVQCAVCQCAGVCIQPVSTSIPGRYHAEVCIPSPRVATCSLAPSSFVLHRREQRCGHVFPPTSTRHAPRMLDPHQPPQTLTHIIMRWILPFPFCFILCGFFSFFLFFPRAVLHANDHDPWRCMLTDMVCVVYRYSNAP